MGDAFPNSANDLMQRSPTHSPQPKSSGSPVCVNKVSLKHSRAHLFILPVCGCFPSATTDVSGCDGDGMAYRA